MSFRILWVLLAIGILPGVALGDEKQAPEHRLSEWKFGKTLFGDRVVPAKLDGQVVVVEYWGVGCDSCVNGLGNLAIIDEKFRDRGVVVIGAEAYRSEKELIGGVVRDQKVKFSITDGISGPISISDLPYAVVFGTDGKMIYHGHPNTNEFQAVIGKAAGAVKNVRKAQVQERTEPKILVEQRTWKNSEGKPLVAAVREVKDGKVHFRLKDGREVPYDLSLLSEKDQQFIKRTVTESVAP